MDKVQKIREEVEKIARSINPYIPDEEGKNSEYEAGRLAMATHILQYIDSMQEEPVSEELEKAAWLYYDKNRLPIPPEWNLHKEFIDFFKAGAQWGKNQTKVEIQAQSMALAHGCPKEPVSEDLPHIRHRDTLDEFAYQCAYDLSNDWAKETPEWKDVKTACKLGANWQKEQFEKNRLTHCDAQTEEEAEIESDFVMSIIENEHRQPTFDDAIKYGMRLKEKEMQSTIELAEDHAMLAGIIKGTEHTIGKVRSILNKVACENYGLDVNGDYCEQPYVELDNEFRKLLKEG